MSTEASAANSGGTCRMRFGSYNQPAPFVGWTVAQVRERLADLWGVPKDANAFIGKTKLEDSHVISPDEEIEFVKRAGEKG